MKHIELKVDGEIVHEGDCNGLILATKTDYASDINIMCDTKDDAIDCYVSIGHALFKAMYE